MLVSLFCGLPSLLSIIRSFVYEESKTTAEVVTFEVEFGNSLYFDNSLQRHFKEEAKLLHESGINEGQGIGFILTSEREVCRSCKKLCLDQNIHVVVG